LKDQIDIFNLNGKASIWWEELRNVKGIHEKDLSWKQFKKHFKKKSSLGFKKKGFKSSRFKKYGKEYRMSLPTISVNQQNFPSQIKNKPFGETLGKTNNPKRKPLKCWGCGEEHLLRSFPHEQKDSRRSYNIQEDTIVNEMARIMPHIYATRDNNQADHQDSVVEMEGMIANHLVSILIDPGSNLSCGPSEY
jgi:hypothetical protein